MPEKPSNLERMKRDQKEALKDFLLYAFGGRAGSPKSYWIAALHAVDRAWTEDKKAAASAIWQEFQRWIPKKTNAKRNPLCPTGGGKEPAVSVFDFVELYQMLRAGQASEAFKRLRQIRGVGPKIASFYLRDVVEFHNLYDPSWGNLILSFLQPVDIWVRATIRFLGIAGSRPDPEVTAAFGGDATGIWNVCRTCKEFDINPLRFNMGAWLFGSDVAGTVLYLEELLHKGPREMTSAALRVTPYTPGRDGRKLLSALEKHGLESLRGNQKE